MLTRLLLSVTGMALSAQGALKAQTPAGTPAGEPVPTTQSPSAPSPQPIPQVPSMPAYGQQGAPPASVPAPMQAPAPAVAPATPSVSAPFVAYQPYGIPDEDRKKDHDGSTYIPEDSWVYPEMMRLYGLGYLDTMNLELRTYTRKSALHMLDESEDAIRSSGSDEAKEIFAVLTRELRTESTDGGTRDRGLVYGVETEYARVMGITGTSLRDSYHLGQTIVNDYGRPYEPGFNLIAGASTVEEFGRFSLYVRGEYQHAPSAPGYSLATATGLALIDSDSAAGSRFGTADAAARADRGTESVPACGGYTFVSSAGP